MTQVVNIAQLNALNVDLRVINNFNVLKVNIQQMDVKKNLHLNASNADKRGIKQYFVKLQISIEKMTTNMIVREIRNLMKSRIIP